MKKTALVTGGSGGIGSEICRALAEDGWQVAVCYKNGRAAAEALVSELKERGLCAEVFYCDIGDKDSIDKCVAEVRDSLGFVTLLVNNAGITRDKLVLNMDEKDFDAVINVNLKGTFNMIKHTYKHFMKKRYGRICSTASIVGLTGNAGQANYSASKAGIIGLTKSVAKELAGRGVTANAVAPGYIATDMTSVLPDKVKDAMKAQIPAKRIGTPDDVADVVAFLCSDDAAYVTGEVIRVDGGLAM